MGKLSVIASLIWFLFFEIMISLLAYATFRGQLCFGRIYFFTLFQSSYFDKQLVFGGSCFFRTAAVFPFYKTVTFSQELFFQNSFFSGAKILQSSQFLRIGNSLRQLLFGTAFFFRRNCRALKKSYFFKARHQPEKTDFSENQFPRYLLFLESGLLEQLLFQKTLPSIEASFSNEILFYNILFQKSYYFTATVPFHSYTSHLFVSN